MALTLEINGVNRTSVVLWRSLVWQQALTSEVDTLSFEVQKFGARTFAPAVLDEVELSVDGTKVFGGNIVSIDERVDSVDRQVYLITVKDYTHLLDRRLVVEKYTSTPVINIICEMLNRYVNKNDRVSIADFESNEIWAITGVGSMDLVNYKTGFQGLKFTSIDNAIVDANRYMFLDLQPSGFSTSDTVEMDAYVDYHDNLSILRIDLGDDTFANYFTGYFQTQCTQDGWNLVKMLKSAFTVSAGAPSWSNIRRVRIRVRSVAGTTVNVTCDNLQVLKPDVFTRDNANTAEQVVNYMAFNYEYPSKCLQRLAELFQWNWYVDENKDINFFAKFDKASVFDLSDTGGDYIYRSLEINSNADQLRNSIYVRGSDYIGDPLFDDLSHQVDGINRIFKLGYKYSAYSVTLNGTVIPVGIENIDQYADNLGVKQMLDGGTALKVGDVAARTYQAQEVVCTRDGRRSSVRLRVRKVGNPVDNFQIRIYDDNGSNQPDIADPLSDLETIAGATLTTSFVEQTITLSEFAPNTLLKYTDDKYHIVTSRSGAADAVNYYEVDTSDTADYDGYTNTGTAVPAWTRQLTCFYFIEGIDFDALYNFQEKTLKLLTVPLAGDTLTLTGLPYYPVFVLYKDNTSVALYGEYQYRIVDKSIKTKEGARQRALQEVLTWAAEVSEAKFTTYEDGLRAGQTINIQSTIRGLDEDYIIQNVTAKARSSGTLEYSVSCVTTKTFGIIYWLQMQILKDDREVEVDDNETEDKIEALSETLTFSVDPVGYTLYVGKVWSNDLGTTPEKLIWNGGATHIWI